MCSRLCQVEVVCRPLPLPTHPLARFLVCLQVNTEPFTGGWMMKVKLSDSDMGGLMDAGDYKAHCEDGGH